MQGYTVEKSCTFYKVNFGRQLLRIIFFIIIDVLSKTKMSYMTIVI